MKSKLLIFCLFLLVACTFVAKKTFTEYYEYCMNKKQSNYWDCTAAAENECLNKGCHE